ncbi:MAG: hypothetical protein JWN15_3449 [Firmicutes bacterium]|nr:hypothetical protein [Bacillota bacterium]
MQCPLRLEAMATIGASLGEPAASAWLTAASSASCLHAASAATRYCGPAVSSYKTETQYPYSVAPALTARTVPPAKTDRRTGAPWQGTGAAI